MKFILQQIKGARVKLAQKEFIKADKQLSAIETYIEEKESNLVENRVSFAEPNQLEAGWISVNEKLPEEMKNILIDYLNKAKAREDWLTIVKFATPTLLQNQVFFIEIITQRATTEAKNTKRQLEPSDIIRDLFSELKLKLVINDSPQ